MPILPHGYRSNHGHPALPRRDFIYNLLPSLPHDVAVDVGAAARQHTRYMKQAGFRRVVAAEPFPGNLPLFQKETAGLGEVELVRAALSDRAGTAAFIVPSVVKGSEPGWEDKAGYSSVGFLSSVGRLALLRAMVGRKTVMRVPIRRLDSLLDMAPDFIEIDVQGAEASVLRGAGPLLRQTGCLYVEWASDEEVTALLEEAGFLLYDSNYLAGPTVKDKAAWQALGFEDIREHNLSTGQLAFEMALARGRPEAAIRGSKGLGWIQTDLIAIRPDLHERFLAAVQGLRAAA